MTESSIKICVNGHIMPIYTLFKTTLQSLASRKKAYYIIKKAYLHRVRPKIGSNLSSPPLHWKQGERERVLRAKFYTAPPRLPPWCCPNLAPKWLQRPILRSKRKKELDREKKFEVAQALETQQELSRTHPQWRRRTMGKNFYIFFKYYGWVIYIVKNIIFHCIFNIF